MQAVRWKSTAAESRCSGRGPGGAGAPRRRLTAARLRAAVNGTTRPPGAPKPLPAGPLSAGGQPAGGRLRRARPPRRAAITGLRLLRAIEPSPAAVPPRSRAPRPRVGPVVDLEEAPGRDGGVLLRRRERRVPQQLLNRPEVGAGVQHVRR